MPTQHDILAELPADYLQSWVREYELDVDDGRVKTQLVDALVESEEVAVEDVLEDLYRNTLKELCRTFGLDGSGREKAPLVARLLGSMDKEAANGGLDTDATIGRP